MNEGLDRQCIIVGAFDRHNFGDLLFAAIARSLLNCDDPVFAGVAARDMREFSGPLTRSLAGLAGRAGRAPAIVHAGGELLSCTAWEAAAMLLPSDGASTTIARLEADGAERAAYIAATLGRSALAPYVAGRDLFPQARAVVFCGVGGIGLGNDEAMRKQVCAALRDADFVGVRDRLTLDLLNGEGVAATLMPDPAVLLRETCGALVARRMEQGECAALRRRLGAYLAVQFSVDFGDDAALDVLAAQLDRVTRETGLALVLFRAGAAPWHDEPDLYARLNARLPERPAVLFRSLDAFDICGLIAGSAGYCGSSLHGRIVAMVHGLPRVNICPAPCDARGKTAAFAAAWDPAPPGAVPPGQILSAVTQALAMPPAVLGEAAAASAAACRGAFDAIRTVLA